MSVPIVPKGTVGGIEPRCSRPVFGLGILGSDSAFRKSIDAGAFLAISVNEVVVFHLTEIVSNTPSGFWIVTALLICFVQRPRCDLGMVRDDLIEHLLIVGELVDRFLAQFRPRFRNGCFDEISGETFSVIAGGFARGSPKNPNGNASVSGSLIGDQFELRSRDDAVCEARVGSCIENCNEFIERIGFKQNPFVTGESAIEAIAKIRVELLLIVRDENHCNVGKGVEIVEDVFFFELIDFVEDDDIGVLVRVTKPIIEDIPRGRLAMNVERPIEPLEQSVEYAIAIVVLPAVDVLGSNVEGVLAELFDSVSSTAGLSDARRSEDRGRFGRLTLKDRCENPREMCQFRVSVDDLLWDERILEHSSVGDHIEQGVASQR